MADGRRTVLMELTISKIGFQGNKWNIDEFESHTLNNPVHQKRSRFESYHFHKIIYRLRAYIGNSCRTVIPVLLY